MPTINAIQPAICISILLQYARVNFRALAAGTPGWNGNEQELEFERRAHSLLALRRKRQFRAILRSVCALAVALLLSVVGAATAFRVESIRNYPAFRPAGQPAKKAA